MAENGTWLLVNWDVCGRKISLKDSSTDSWSMWSILGV